MPFKKGQSGNPRGRQSGVPNKATADLKAAAQLHTKEMLTVLVKIAKDKEAPPAARVGAAKTVVEFGHGKAAQAITDPDGNALSIPQMVQFLITKAPGADCRD